MWKIIQLLAGCLSIADCLDNMQKYLRDTCYHTEIEAADHICYVTRSEHTNIKAGSPSYDAIMLDVWQGSHFSTNL